MKNKLRKHEIGVYAVLWLLLFLIPLLMHYMETSRTGVALDFSIVWRAWLNYIPFLVLFVIHDFLIAPILIRRHHKKAYFTVVAAAIILFSIANCSILETDRHGRPPGGPQAGMDNGDPHAPQPDDAGVCYRPPLPHGHEPGGEDEPKVVMHGQEPINPVWFIQLILATSMCGMNTAVKLFFKSRDDELRLAELERQGLQKELDFLTYQINPHFFMNTLNNIHALIDIAPDKAKDAVIELSKMMRYVLYDGNTSMVPLTKELDFIGHYIALMKLRYIRNVDISIVNPPVVPDRLVPPLLLVTFIENAFKHGVSYRHPSFVEVRTVIEGEVLHFICRNSRIPGEQPSDKGVGLLNIRKRLDLIYTDSYQLDINHDEDTWSVSLKIPLKS